MAMVPQRAAASTLATTYARSLQKNYSPGRAADGSVRW
jgi:hypothetical protein